MPAARHPTRVRRRRRTGACRTNLRDAVNETPATAVIGGDDGAGGAGSPKGGVAFMPSSAPATGRDLRLDLFRGIALWLIFLDHIPSNIVNWITIRNFGFSDATEVFVFISGYTATFVYGRAMREQGSLVASARILKRAWQVYVAHIFLFAIYTAEISHVAHSFENPLYREEMGILDFLAEPDLTLVQAMLLKFKPANMDVLPLYIVLLAGFPPLLWLLIRAPAAALALSASLYAAALGLDWNFPAYPNGHWVFNPLAWQFLFVFGGWCATTRSKRLAAVVAAPATTAIAVAFLVFALFMVLTWSVPALETLVPEWLSDLMYPIDKTNLSPLRIMHFLSLAVVTMRLVPRDAAALRSPWLRPAVLCGQHSLEIFCLGVFLSFAAHFAMVEIDPGVGMQIVASLSGIVVMVATAALLSWYNAIEARKVRPRTEDTTLAGGGA